MSWNVLQKRLQKLEEPADVPRAFTLAQLVARSMGEEAGPPARVLRPGDQPLESAILAATPDATGCRPVTHEDPQAQG